jgi:hypothetical protein
MRRAVLVVGLVILAVTARVAAHSSTVTVHHNANLRATPSTQSAILDHLEPGDQLTLEEPTKHQGFWHVRTSTNVVGWVYQTLVHIDETDDVPAAPGVTAADVIDPTWTKPPIVGSSLSGPPGFPACPADGEAGGDIETNKRKNRKDSPSSYHAVKFDAVANLAYPTAAKTSRTNWTAEQKDAIAPFEGIPISIVGFIVAVKKQSGGGGEGTNCHFNTTNFVDTHVALVKSPGQGEEKAIVVEPTPRFYAQHPSWIFSKLDDLDDSPDPVRISGWLLLDPVHKGHLGTYRTTLWEIHPITKIEVFKNGHWTVW